MKTSFVGVGVVLLATVVGGVACTKEQGATAETSQLSQAAGTAKPQSAESEHDTVAPAVKDAPARGEGNSAAQVGQPAPDFELPDLDGKRVKLSDFKGKTVVLEWFNPGCPFVQRSHNKGSLKGLADKHAEAGVVWLAVNSGAPGKQGAGTEANREAANKFGMQHPVLLDEQGKVGKQYGAAHTPHMYVIDQQGVLVYRGAIDNSPDGEGESPTGGKLVNYVDVALTSLAQNQPIAVSDTEAYGCSVKYAQ